MDTDSTALPVPWTSEYNEHRARTLQSIIGDSSLIRLFAGDGSLPAGHGRGLDERCVEYPWLLSRLPEGPATVLDAGSALNHALLLDQRLLSTKRISIVTLAPERECFWQRGISYAFDDLRSLPFKDDLFDVAVSISTLEHVGCDNAFYTGSPSSTELRLDDYAVAVREIARVLKPGGTLLMTVPYGVYQFHGAFQQFDRQRLSKAEGASDRLTTVGESFYRYSADGWQIARDEDCGNCEYVAWVSELMRTGRWPDAPPVDADHAAAARAVACVKMMKTSTAHVSAL